MKNHLRIVLLALASTAASTHQEPIDSDWCKEGHIEVLAEFSYTSLMFEHQLETGQACQRELGPLSCGQFDDDYSLARTLADNQCASYQGSEIEFELGTIKPIFHAPDVFKNAQKEHHDLYRKEMGLVFSCARCSAR